MFPGLLAFLFSDFASSLLPLHSPLPDLALPYSPLTFSTSTLGIFPLMMSDLYFKKVNLAVV